LHGLISSAHNREDTKDIRILLGLLSTLRQLRRRERWLRPQFEAYQADSLRRLRAHAYARSPFYQQFHKGVTGRPLQELPVLTKAILMEHFDELVTDRAIRLADVQAHAASDRTASVF
jgi:phenylacetate-CoA ligase